MGTSTFQLRKWSFVHEHKCPPLVQVELHTRVQVPTIRPSACLSQEWSFAHECKCPLLERVALHARAQVPSACASVVSHITSSASCLCEWCFASEHKQPLLMCEAPFVRVEDMGTCCLHKWSCVRTGVPATHMSPPLHCPGLPNVTVGDHCFRADGYAVKCALTPVRLLNYSVDQEKDAALLIIKTTL